MWIDRANSRRAWAKLLKINKCATCPCFLFCSDNVNLQNMLKLDATIIHTSQQHTLHCCMWMFEWMVEWETVVECFVVPWRYSSVKIQYNNLHPSTLSFIHTGLDWKVTTSCLLEAFRKPIRVFPVSQSQPFLITNVGPPGLLWSILVKSVWQALSKSYIKQCQTAGSEHQAMKKVTQCDYKENPVISFQNDLLCSESNKWRRVHRTETSHNSKFLCDLLIFLFRFNIQVPSW